MDEFNLIAKYFTLSPRRDDVLLAVGDDAAIMAQHGQHELVMSMDTLISDVHFPANTSPADIAYKAVAVNLSDIAAMGAEPAWLMLSLSLPEINDDWLREFSDSFADTCNTYGVDLIGGDTTRGPLSITVHASGVIASGTALRRDAAMPGDGVYVSGNLGDAALALRLLNSEQQVESCLHRLNRPEPRVMLGQALVTCSRCAIDISDGLLSDLGHILNASQCGAKIDLSLIPRSQAFCKHTSGYDELEAMRLAVSGGDDYELCFTVPQQYQDRLQALAKQSDTSITCIGTITSDSGLVLSGVDQAIVEAISARHKGFMHFG